MIYHLKTLHGDKLTFVLRQSDHHDYHANHGHHCNAGHCHHYNDIKKSPYHEVVQLLCIHNVVLVMVKTLYCCHLLLKTYSYMFLKWPPFEQQQKHSGLSRNLYALPFDHKTLIGINPTNSWTPDSDIKICLIFKVLAKKTKMCIKLICLLTKYPSTCLLKCQLTNGCTFSPTCPFVQPVW